MSRVSVNKDLIDDLADSIRDKFDEDLQLSLADMKDVVDDIPKRSSTDLTASGATVTASAGYYANDASKSVSSMTLPTAASSTASGTSKATISRSTSNQYINIPTGYNGTASYYTISATPNGTAGTPTATKGTVSNHQVTVTPSVTNTAGYITGGTKTGTAVTVTASELASGSKSISANGTGIDVVGYSTVDVAVPSDVFECTYAFQSAGGNVTFSESYADIKAAWNAGKFVYLHDNYMGTSVARLITFYTNYTFNGRLYTEALAFRLSCDPSWEIYDVIYGYSGGVLTQDCTLYLDPPASGTMTITENGTGIDVTSTKYVDVNVQPSYTATISGTTGSSNSQFVRTGTTSSYSYYYTNGDTFTFKPGDQIYFRVIDRSYYGYVRVNGTQVAGSANAGASYTYTAPASDIEIVFPSGTYIDINELGPRPVNITFDTSSIAGTIGLAKLVYVKNPTSATWSDKLVYYMDQMANDEYPYAVYDSMVAFVGYAPFTTTISSIPYMYLPDSEYKLAMLMPSYMGDATFSGNISSEVYWAPDLRGFSTAFRLITGDFTVTFT